MNIPIIFKKIFGDPQQIPFRHDITHILDELDKLEKKKTKLFKELQEKRHACNHQLVRKGWNGHKYVYECIYCGYKTYDKTETNG